MKRLSSLAWLLIHLPSVIAGRLGNLVYSYRQKLLPSRRPLFKGFSPLRKNGINLAAYIRAEMGLGQAARGIAAALEAAELPFNIVNFEIGNLARHTDVSWSHKETRNPEYDVTILVINPDNIGNAKLWLPKTLFANSYVIAYWFWELQEIPDSWLPSFSLVDEVWAASRFIEEALRDRVPVPVSRIPPVVQLHGGDTLLPRQRLNLPEQGFLFLSMCDASSVMERKNPRATIRAFQKAFDKNDSRVGLVLKVRERHPFRRDMAAIRKEIEGWSNIYVLEQTLNRQELNSLLAVTDCFVSLHRSEGFGLVPAEAMWVGKPVIMTRWSGNTDYMTSDNSIGVDYQLVKLQQDYGPYKAGQVWAEPNINQAAHWMEKLARDRDLANTIGECGRKTIQDAFSPSVVGDLIRKRLSQIRKQHR